MKFVTIILNIKGVADGCTRDNVVITKEISGIILNSETCFKKTGLFFYPIFRDHKGEIFCLKSKARNCFIHKTQMKS